MTLLLLAGTGEARRIAARLAQTGYPVIASLAGATRDPEALPVETRIGGFGGDEPFRDWLGHAGIAAILDATHPFASRISQRAARIAREQRLPYCLLLRPEWRPEAGDRWVFLEQESEAVDHIPAGARVFLATGRQTLAQFANLSACDLTLRQIDPPEQAFPFANGRFLVGRPPFSVEDEMALFTKLKIDWLVVKNAGGEAPRSKLIAARRLGLPVAVINRPIQPDAPQVETVEQALSWVESL
ncbi:cobalt-precorrin-6A reductase [Thalassovita taeanensis]|uniref:Precorrin-6A/cobalt-precorrin-6A reductase n=1 Tax=Thalassovita taeanensis TaxID=657014 RepID=A0A1H8YTS9_9RHOB|nr:cobalt-precorrin-6A reductase [Thalassovita taeanensis]SEP55482.1 precorrin-6A/cobalt-precorrin-6A reductase [Thalassovita taeanensis]